MVNSVKAQTAAASVTAANRARKNRVIKGVGDVIGVQIPDLGGDASAYAYVPGKPYSHYGAEQIAQQIEDLYENNPALNGAGRAHVAAIQSRMADIPAGKKDPETETALNTRFEIGIEGTPGIVWHGPE
jgi:hypothetical protein